LPGSVPLSHEAQRGIYLHPTFAVTPQREPLGVLDAWMWAREPKAPDGTRPGIKESVRWSEGCARAAERAVELPDTRLVDGAARESGIREPTVRARDLGTPADWLVRFKHNPALPEGGPLWARSRPVRLWGDPLDPARGTRGAPPGVKPTEWRLRTIRRAETLDEVTQSIDRYRARWEIEPLLLVIEVGCRVEALRLATIQRLAGALALFLVVAWRIA
jgi:hypothetical protein